MSQFAPKPPFISVLMSVYNGERYLQDSIKSILNQTFSDFEFVIVNDGSTDSTLSIIGEFKDPRIVIKNIAHGGLANALNCGLGAARGEFLARMDADDIALPTRLERQIAFLEQNPVVAVLGTAYEILRNDGTRLPASVPLLRTNSEIKKILPRFNPFMHGSVMVRRRALEDVGFYDKRFLLAQDYDLWFRISKQHHLANLDEVLMLRREGEQTLEKEAKQNWFAIRVRIKAIRDGNSNIMNVVYLIRPFLVVIAPTWLKFVIRQTLLRFYR